MKLAVILEYLSVGLLGLVIVACTGLVIFADTKLVEVLPTLLPSLIVFGGYLASPTVGKFSKLFKLGLVAFWIVTCR